MGWFIACLQLLRSQYLSAKVLGRTELIEISFRPATAPLSVRPRAPPSSPPNVTLVQSDCTGVTLGDATGKSPKPRASSVCPGIGFLVEAPVDAFLTRVGGDARATFFDAEPAFLHAAEGGGDAELFVGVDPHG